MLERVLELDGVKEEQGILYTFGKARHIGSLLVKVEFVKLPHRFEDSCSGIG